MLPESQPLSRFYVDRLTDVAIGADVAVLEERKYCAHCSSLQVALITSRTRTSTLVVPELPRRPPALPAGTVVRGSLVSQCLVCGQRRREHGRMERVKMATPQSKSNAATANKRAKRKAHSHKLLSQLQQQQQGPPPKQRKSSLGDFLSSL